MLLRYTAIALVLCATVGLGAPGCVPFFDTEPTGELVDFTANACGGSAALRFDSSAAAPGDSCGVCTGEGHLACNGVDALRCVGARRPNACGGCVSLEAEPFAVCGGCSGAGSGYFICAGTDALECINEAGYTSCGGCAPLQGEPGQPCDGDDPTASWTCSTPNEVQCTTGGPNMCGGEADLTFAGIAAPAPGLACPGPCDPPGVLRCDGPEEVRCEEAGQVNVCDGCGPIPGELEADCGQCGRYICNDGSMFCVDQEPNACGGCAELPATPGDSCDGGTIVCNGDDAVICVPQTDETNACGGLGELSNPPGTTCGTCDSGLWVCDGTSSVSCEGDLGREARNGCGGCAELPASDDDPCGECGSGIFACDPDNADRLICEGDQGAGAQNLCGGCAFLWGEPGRLCGDCSLWSCPESSPEAVICAFVGDRPDGCPVDCSGCEDQFRECVDGGCGECIEGYIEEDADCVLDSPECSGNEECRDGGPVLTGVCGRVNPDTCSEAGSGPGSFEAGLCDEGLCDTETVSVDVDCIFNIVGEPCLDEGLVGVCTATEECVLPNVVYRLSDPSSDAEVTSPHCPDGYLLTSGGCSGDGGNPFYSSGPLNVRPNADGDALLFDESWSCERSDDNSDAAVHHAIGVCVREDLIRERWFVGAVTGTLLSEGESPECAGGFAIGGGCTASPTNELTQMRPTTRDVAGGDELAPEEGRWSCGARDPGALAIGAMCGNPSDGLLSYTISGPSSGINAEVGCREGFLIGGGCWADDGRSIFGSHPFPLTGGARQWRCSATLSVRRTVRAIAVCLVL